VHYDGALYHVIARGNNRANVFETDEEKEKYLEILADYKERYDFQLYAYVIMDNHVHLLLQIGKNPLSKIMQGIQQRYTQYYNGHCKHSGHVFEQRYKAILCEKESYLMALICYIHQNPVRANIPEGINHR
jgi:REP element-mobilizing transposase RayT